MLLRSIGRKVNQMPLPYRTKHGAGGSSVSLTAPDATWVSDAATAQAVFDVDVDEDVIADSDTILGEAYTDAGLTTLFDSEEETITSADLVDGDVDVFAFTPFTTGTYYVRFCIRRGGVQISPWSDTISKAISLSSPTYFIYGF